jgi:hypothetical protein
LAGISESLAKALRGVSRLDHQWPSRFEHTLRRDEPRYADSWLYLLRVTRDDLGQFGYLLARGSGNYGIGFRKNVVYLLPPSNAVVSDLAVSDVEYICSTIGQINGKDIILKQVDSSLALALLNSGRFKTAEDWADRKLLEDEAYPEKLVDLDRLFVDSAGISPSARNFCRKVVRFTRSCEELVTAPIDESIFKITDWAAPIADKLMNYCLMMQAVSMTESVVERAYFTRIYRNRRGLVEGIYIAQRLNKETAGLYCSITSKSSNGITEWMDASFFRYLWEAGVKKLLLGGSETVGVAQYIRKLPIDSPRITSQPLIYIQPCVEHFPSRGSRPLHLPLHNSPSGAKKSIAPRLS